MFQYVSFKTVTSMAAGLCSILFLTLLLAPELIYSLFALVASNTSNLLAKRAGMLFLGITVLLLAVRNTSSQELISAVSLSMTVTFTGLIVVGVYEFISGTAGPGIWVAICGEAIFVILFLTAWLNHKRGSND